MLWCEEQSIKRLGLEKIQAVIVHDMMENFCVVRDSTDYIPNHNHKAFFCIKINHRFDYELWWLFWLWSIIKCVLPREKSREQKRHI